MPYGLIVMRALYHGRGGVVKEGRGPAVDEVPTQVVIVPTEHPVHAICMEDFPVSVGWFYKVPCVLISCAL